ncbi:NAD(P)H-dependent oxidoreductase [Lewinella sp. W8]|uniref:NAD(P)H-dependent oxidoreductase n=1 Tax=Lewinella sp. W8 TaxID=2528208 RepID=UPI0010673710|nr:NAD(P)H-dependent oxidoreductase [Lewinella sp. W8]MTB52323.1 NAD(P)H-dependent oxidoreductase [Lewinella sp. W8]
MDTPTQTSLLADLNWRYATKKFDPTRKLSAEDVSFLMEAINLTPTSYGLQPFRVLIVENPEVREQLKAASYGQTQITDASHLFVFAYKLDMSENYVDDFMARIADARGVDVSALEGYGNTIKGSVAAKGAEVTTEWNRRQTYIAVGNLLTAAATLRVDACPMEGFDPAKYDEILGLKEQGLEATVAVPVGYRSAEDAYQHLAKVRLPLDELFQTV